LLACMTANREPRLIKALKRQGGDGLAANRRFFSFCKRSQGDRVATAMSAFGTKQTSRRAQSMSAFAGKAHIGLTPRNVCF